MSFGSTAYASYVRIRSESDEQTFPDWTSLPHIRRLAWEAAAQAVALAVLPISMIDDLTESDDDPIDNGEEVDELSQESIDYDDDV